ncbi:MAG: hypothetical protein ACRD3T_05995 [Terriglobia bacterium]
MNPIRSEQSYCNLSISTRGRSEPAANDHRASRSVVLYHDPGPDAPSGCDGGKSGHGLAIVARITAVLTLFLFMALPVSAASGVEKPKQPSASPASSSTPLVAAAPGIEKANQSNPPEDSAAYILCPADAIEVDGSGSGATIACSESLMDPHEVSDIFGKRIANTYLVAEVKVRNLSDDYEYLLHDVRLGYKGLAVTSRDKRLVRGVAEKGQLLDTRNVLIRGVQAVGSVGGGLSTLSFATAGLKNALNLFQGPFTSALKGFLPDFTVNQMNRLDDNAFTVQTSVVPKKSSMSVVVFLSGDVFLCPTEQKALHLSWRGKRNGNEGSTLLNIQHNLTVEVAGVHVSEVNTDQPVLSTIDPPSATAGATKVALTLFGKNLDHAAKVRIGTGTGAPEATLQLVDLKPTLAKATIDKMPGAGSYDIYLETPTGQDQKTTETITVK